MVHSKSDRERTKIINDKCQSLIEALLKSEDNKFCVDCDAKGPRWASWNLGIFLCIRCAGIHRNLGVHISKVKSVNLDSWTPEHVAYMQRMGNSRARAVYEANLPDDFRRPQTDAGLEAFIRAKYEQRKYIAHNWVDPGPPQPAFNVDEEFKRIKEQKRAKSSNSKSSAINLASAFPNSKPRPPDSSNLKDKTKNTPGLFDLRTVAATAELAPKSLSSSTNEQLSQSAMTNNNKDKTSYFDLLSDSIGPSANITAGSTSLIDIKSTSGNIFDTSENENNKSEQNNIFDMEPSIKPTTEDNTKKVLSKEAILSLYSFSNSSAVNNSDPFGLSIAPTTNIQANKVNQQSNQHQLPYGLTNLNINKM